MDAAAPMDAKNAPIGAWKTAQALFPTAPTAIIFILIKIHEKTGVRAERTDECRELIIMTSIVL